MLDFLVFLQTVNDPLGGSLGKAFNCGWEREVDLQNRNALWVIILRLLEISRIGITRQSSLHSNYCLLHILRLARATGYCSVLDLKLGNSGDFRDKYKDPRDSLMESASSESSKRAKTLKNATRVPSCLVDGCTSDLTRCRDYHRRHKVCELHSKSRQVLIRGQEQRFCQQCSRFHSLGEFDEGKRSCRKRLEGHNRRRRKPQPEPLSLNSASIFSNQGARYLHFGSSQIFPTSAMNNVWTGAAKAESDPILHTSDQSSMNFDGRKNLFPGSLSFNYKEGKQFPFLQGTCSTVPGDSVHLDASSTLGNSGNGQKMFSDGLNRVIDSSRALSLLSSPPSGTREMGLSDIMQPDLNSPAQSLIPSLNYNNYNALRMESTEPAGSVLVSDGSSGNANSQHMFQTRFSNGSKISRDLHMLNKKEKPGSD